MLRSTKVPKMSKTSFPRDGSSSEISAGDQRTPDVKVRIIATNAAVARSKKKIARIASHAAFAILFGGFCGGLNEEGNGCCGGLLSQ